MSASQDGSTSTCFNPISSQRTSHHFVHFSLHLMMFAHHIVVFRVIGWEAELDYSFPLDWRRQHSRLDWVIFIWANTFAGSPKTSASLTGEFCPMVSAVAGCEFKLVFVQGGIGWHSTNILLLKGGVWFLVFRPSKVTSVCRRRCSWEQHRNIVFSRAADLIWGNSIQVSRLIPLHRNGQVNSDLKQWAVAKMLALPVSRLLAGLDRL